MGTELQQIGNANNLKAMLMDVNCQKAILGVLPRHLTPERMAKLAMIAASRTPKLLQCTRLSVMQAIMRASELGLDCSGTMGQAYLIPYGKECTFIPGYRGLMELARRSGRITTFNAYVVYQNDNFEYSLGLSPNIIHNPCTKGDRGPLIAVYAVACFKDGGNQFEVMYKSDVDKVRKQSKASGSGPWVDHYDEMARKTVVRKLCKYLPLSSELEKAITWGDEAEFGNQPIKRVESTVTPGMGASSLKDAMGIGEEGSPEPAPEEKKPRRRAARKPDPEKTPEPEPTEPVEPERLTNYDRNARIEHIETLVKECANLPGWRKAIAEHAMNLEWRNDDDDMLQSHISVLEGLRGIIKTNGKPADKAELMSYISDALEFAAAAATE